MEVIGSRFEEEAILLLDAELDKVNNVGKFLIPVSIPPVLVFKSVIRVLPSIVLL